MQKVSSSCAAYDVAAPTHINSSHTKSLPLHVLGQLPCVRQQSQLCVGHTCACPAGHHVLTVIQVAQAMQGTGG